MSYTRRASLSEYPTADLAYSRRAVRNAGLQLGNRLVLDFARYVGPCCIISRARLARDPQERDDVFESGGCRAPPRGHLLPIAHAEKPGTFTAKSSKKIAPRSYITTSNRPERRLPKFEKTKKATRARNGFACIPFALYED